MKCRAAVLRGAGKSWEVCQIDLGAPRAGEVLVQMAVSGICHSDDHYATGAALRANV
jgi:Zn-dependent alcohol dehydrogenase